MRVRMTYCRRAFEHVAKVGERVARTILWADIFLPEQVTVMSENLLSSKKSIVYLSEMLELN
jgi:hypothetical protein